ncbi:acyl-CoA N-acyltransferase [Pseudomonas phage Skulduggery]|uniref:Acyl-CoA N-acyltransferase n=1 Tax=Pseudomonas phage Skulduggery TaxID=2006671 RepID=A0A1Y0SZC0_9CAUD|nr:acyl-CoA N-acyltransferase [Pseudomonas phage Skulduggery]ARV77123.1 acyl-CoA N-acyltransferase [Pseudomonas phage Skulduggery]
MSLKIRLDSGPLLDWAAARYDRNAIDGDTHALGIEVDGVIRAVAMYNNFNTVSCSMHVVSDDGKRWASRTFLSAAFSYPFVQLGLKRVTAMVPAKNTDALCLDLRLGFKVEGTMAEATDDDDIVVMGMLRRNCMWITEEQRHGR